MEHENKIIIKSFLKPFFFAIAEFIIILSAVFLGGQVFYPEKMPLWFTQPYLTIFVMLIMGCLIRIIAEKRFNID